jgi:hypothetical protein
MRTVGRGRRLERRRLFNHAELDEPVDEAGPEDVKRLDQRVGDVVVEVENCRPSEEEDEVSLRPRAKHGHK